MRRLLILFVSLSPASDSLGQTFSEITAPDGYEVRPLDLSDDGSTVVGVYTSGNGLESFRWTAGSGLVGLGDLDGGFFSGEATSVSADGSVIAGRSSVDTTRSEAMRSRLTPIPPSRATYGKQSSEADVLKRQL